MPPDPSPLRRAGARVVGGGRRGARSAGAAMSRGGARFRGYLASEGAGESGLARLTELQVVNSAADAAVTVALAGTIFALPTGEARSQVALFLAVTMAPFAVVAPLIGPILDRFPYARRWAMGSSLALRAFLAWVAAGALMEQSGWLFPVALGILVASKAYAVSRASGVPLVVPPSITLVTANARVSVTNLVGMGVGGALAVALSQLGAHWALRGAFVLYVVATILAIRLTDRVDSPRSAPLGSAATPIPGARATPPAPPEPRTLGDRAVRWVRRFLRAFPPSVRAVMWAAVGSRLLSGFLTVYLVFLARTHPPQGWSGALLLGAVGAAASAGTAVATMAGQRIRGRAPDAIGFGVVVCAVGVVAVAAALPSAWTFVAAGLTSGFTSQLVKLCLDAIVQRDVPERTRSRVFGWSETWLQTSWVAGGAAGIALPAAPRLAFAVVALAMLVVLGLSLRRRLHPAPPQVTAGPRP